MATFTVTHKQRVDDVVVLRTLEPNGIEVGQTITVSGVDATFNGTVVVQAVPNGYFLGVDDFGDYIFDNAIIYTNQLLYHLAGDDVALQSASGTVAWSVSPTWITSQNVLDWLGIDPATANDTAFVATCVNASNAWCYRKRREAGYHDNSSVAPSNDVKLGAIMYAAILYRERGAVDGFASFDSMNLGAPTMTLGRIMQLLGCNRSQVA